MCGGLLSPADVCGVFCVQTPGDDGAPPLVGPRRTNSPLACWLDRCRRGLAAELGIGLLLREADGAQTLAAVADGGPHEGARVRERAETARPMERA